MNLNKLILKNLNFNEEYTRKVLPFLKSDYFSERRERLIFNEISSFVSDYSNIPTYEALVIQLNEKQISDEEYKETLELLTEFNESKTETVDLDWLVNKTEEFCQDRAVINAVRESITILDGKHKDLSKGSIPTLLSEALSVSFDSSVGHDYLTDADNRFEYYHRIEERVPFSLEYFNKITNNGLPKKTLNVILAPPHTGKTLMMCNFAADFQLSGRNVLYITCEMAEEEIAKRIDANLLRVSMDELMQMDKPSYDKKMKYLKSKTTGKLFIKEYPTAAANVNHFRTLLNELRLKKNFVPDVVFVDYLNICASSRMKMSGSINSYTYVQAIAQELRGFAQEFNIPVVTATQTTRSGSQSSDVDMSDVSESFGVPAIADFMFAIINSDELYELNQLMIKQLKNRYRDLNLNKRFVIGVDRSKMKLYDVENSAQEGIVDAGSTKAEDTYKTIQTNKAEKKSFEGFKI